MAVEHFPALAGEFVDQLCRRPRLRAVIEWPALVALIPSIGFRHAQASNSGVRGVGVGDLRREAAFLRVHDHDTAVTAGAPPPRVSSRRAEAYPPVNRLRQFRSL